MKAFYNFWIVMGWFGVAALMSLVSYAQLPWWKWVIFWAAYLCVEFGAFASRDKKNEEAK